MSIIGSNNAMNIMASALDAYTMRNSTIASNIANVDTPGYKRKEVKFEEYLQDAVGSLNDTRNIANKNSKGRIAHQFGNIQVGVGTVKAEIVDQSTDAMYRIDGNNVDIDNEMTEIVKNQLRYQTVINGLNNQFQAMRTAMGK